MDAVKIAIVGSGPAGLGAAVRAAELGLSHLLLESRAHLANTIQRYQKRKLVMAEPSALPLCATLPFAAGSREAILEGWVRKAAEARVRLRHQAEVTAIEGGRDAFTLRLADGGAVRAERVVLAIGLQGNPTRLGCEGDDLPFVQYQLDDPDEYRDEGIVIVGAGDAAIENALALSAHNRVTVVNRRDDFDRAKQANHQAILKAIEAGEIAVVYNARVSSVRGLADGGGTLVLATAQGTAELACQRVIARLGAVPPRAFIESCGIVFPSREANAVPAVSARYESNVAGIHIVGALAGFPLIKQAINQGHEVVEFIEGRSPEPADAPLLRAKFSRIPGFTDIEHTLARIRKRVPVLEPLTALQLREFLLDSEIRTPRDGEAVFQRNDYSDSFYSVLDGAVEIAPDPEKPELRIRLGAGEFFGEMSLISGRRRSATVTALAGAVLIETPRRSMNKLIASVAAVKRVLDETYLARAVQALLPGIGGEVLKGVVAGADIRHYKAGETLFNEGEAADGLHLIRKGSVTVARQIAGRETVMAYVPAGQYVGEMALLTDRPRGATVKAAIATETIRLDAAAFKALMAARPELAERMLHTMQQRVTANASRREAQSESTSLVQFLVKQGLGEATDVLLIDESLCVRCDHCERACADTHGGLSRLDREAGPTFEHLHVPTSCRHCEHPHCMKDCPPDAIRRSPAGEVFITDACIGCGNCEKNCPYGVIQMGTVSEKKPSLVQWLLLGGAAPGTAPAKAAKGSASKAVKCDMCKGLKGGPACVRACPTGAAVRVSPERFMRLTQS